MSKKKPEEQGEAPAPTFEKALARLETIVKDMESGKLSLEQMMADFEEGQGLVQWCSRKLNEVEHKIEVLVKDGDRLATQPFETPEEPPAEGKAPADDGPTGLF